MKMIKSKLNFSTIIWILFYVLLFSILLKNSFSYLDTDFGWHLKVGQEIWQTKQVPNLNYYNFPLVNTTWVDHEWLINTITYLLYNHFGYIILSLIFVCLPIFVWLYLKKQISQKFSANSAFLIMILQILGLLASLPHLGVRMQEINLLNLIFLLAIISRFNAKKNYLLLFSLWPLIFFWTCLHAGYLLGLGVLFFWIGVKFIEFIFWKYKKCKFLNFDNVLKFKQIAIFFLFSLSSFIFTFFTPYKTNLYSFLNGYRNSFYLTHIKEWLPQYYFPFNYWQHFYIALVVLAIVYSIAFYKKIGKVKLWNLAISAFFVFMSIKSARHFPILFIVSFELIFLFLYNFLDLSRVKIKKIFGQNIVIVKSFLIAAFLLVIVLQITQTKFTNDPFKSNCNKFPCQAIEFIKNNDNYKDFSIFNHYGWGGYIIWEWPGKTIFIDGRLPQYVYENHTFLEEYFEFFQADTVADKLAKHNINLVLLKSNLSEIKVNWFEKYFFGIDENQLNNDKSNQLVIYLEENNWQKVYSDQTAQIYVKPESRN